MSFQAGDQRVVIGGRRYTLRLTLGALSEISARLSAPSPQALSQILRSLTAVQARSLLDCLATAPLEPAALLALSDDALAALLPAICRVFEHAFAPMTGGQNAER